MEHVQYALELTNFKLDEKQKDARNLEKDKKNKRYQD